MDGDLHQSLLPPEQNKFHRGNGGDGKHYWLTPPELYAALDAEFGPFDFDPCPYPLPEDFDGLTCEWGQRNYVNPPFGSIIHQGRKKGPTAWVRKAIEEWQKGKLVVLVYPVDKWVLMLVKAIFGEHGHIRNLGDVRWLAIEDGSQGKGTGRHIACFILTPDPKAMTAQPTEREREKAREMVTRWNDGPLRSSTDLEYDIAQALADARAEGIEAARAAVQRASDEIRAHVQAHAREKGPAWASSLGNEAAVYDRAEKAIRALTGGIGDGNG